MASCLLLHLALFARMIIRSLFSFKHSVQKNYFVWSVCLISVCLWVWFSPYCSVQNLWFVHCDDCDVYDTFIVFWTNIDETILENAKLCELKVPLNPNQPTSQPTIRKYTVTDVRSGPARVVRWLDHLGAMYSRAWRAWCAVGSGFNSSRGPVRHVRLRKSNYVKIIPTHMMIREIIPGRQQRVRRCPL